MTGKTSLFTILTGVHQETRIGSTAARTGVAKVPDARLDALAKLFEPPKITLRHGGIRGHAVHLEGESARPELRGQPARGGRLRPRAAPVRRRDRAAREGLGGSRCAIWKTSRPSSSSATWWWSRSAWSAWTRIARRSRIPSSTASSSCSRSARRCSKQNQPLRQLELDADDEKRIRGFQFLSQKPMLYVLNIGEEDAGKLHETRGGVSRRPAGRPRAHRRHRQSAARSKRSWPNCRARSSANIWPATA